MQPATNAQVLKVEPESGEVATDNAATDNAATDNAATVDASAASSPHPQGSEAVAIKEETAQSCSSDQALS